MQIIRTSETAQLRFRQPAVRLEVADHGPDPAARLHLGAELEPPVARRGSHAHDDLVATAGEHPACGDSELRAQLESPLGDAAGGNVSLDIRATHESDTHGPDQYTSARRHTLPENGWTYGRIAARIQLPYGRGIWPAFWMLGSNIDENGGDTPWPDSGEIDILEMYGSRDNAVVEANIHYAGRSGRHANMGAVGARLDHGKFADNFHVFEIEWDADSIQWFVDGERFASTSISGSEFSEFHKPFFILLNIAVGGRSAGRADDTTRFPQTMYVDWVRVYQQESREN